MEKILKNLIENCPDVDEAFIREHVSRLGNDYFKGFTTKDLCLHLNSLYNLSKDQPIDLIINPGKEGEIHCTVLSFDYPGVFSLISGILTGMGLMITSGDIFTYGVTKRKKPSKTRGKQSNWKTNQSDLWARKRIIDHFTGHIDTHLTLKDWQTTLRKRLEETIQLLEQGDETSINKAKQKVNEWVVGRLNHIMSESSPRLYPVRISTDNEVKTHTRLKVVSEDTPAFLYALSTALALQGISIEHIRIRTIRGRVEDELLILDKRGRLIEDSDLLNRISFSVLLTKQFTYFLEKAPDPFSALSRFEFLVNQILDMPGQETWIHLLSDPLMLRELARLLGTSDFLWEDFIRLQYETLLPMLQPHDLNNRLFQSFDTQNQRLKEALKGLDNFEEKKQVVNNFKDREIFQIDLDHILNSESDFNILSERLTKLAELVVHMSFKIIYDHLAKRYGEPMTIAGLKARWAVLGLGKLGGAALGYASDIEIIVVYSDNGQTNGKESINNSEFFNRLVKEFSQFIKAKREGIFNIDLRLRPYGSAGSLASSLETFCRYYGEGGSARSFERLALVRLRFIAGDRDFGRQLERIRDELVYSAARLDLEDLREIRIRQFQEKSSGSQLNAKFSPGGLVDLEYGVQLLQVMYGHEYPDLKTPLLHQALESLQMAGILFEKEAKQLIEAYHFMRTLINGLRMLRGSASDLILPPRDSEELKHLARRIGYERGKGLDAAQQLYVDFETHTATIRLFVERHFGRQSLPVLRTGNVVDLIYSESMDEESRQKILQDAGFRNTRRAWVNIKSLAGKETRRDTFARLSVLALDILRHRPDPDMALNNWERYTRSIANVESHYRTLMSQPMHLEILLSVFAGSQFLADTLIRNPGFFDWVMIPKNLWQPKDQDELRLELDEASASIQSHSQWLNRLRRLRRREILRIGIRDIVLGISAREVISDLSRVAKAFIQAVFQRTCDRLGSEGISSEQIKILKNNFCIMALGKLGGHELNYSSDIDLLGFRDDRENQTSTVPKKLYTKVMEGMIADLSQHTEEGYVYRVDMRLRPYGSSGELIPTRQGLIDYYQNKASLWEIQAALKMRPVAGNQALGYHLLEKIEPIMLQPRDSKDILQTVERMRTTAVKSISQKFGPVLDVKSSYGGIRDVEFLVQGLQLIHGPMNPGLLHENTLSGLRLLQEGGFISAEVRNQLEEDYLFLRRVEHYLQILDDQQIHQLPKGKEAMNILARKITSVENRGEKFIEDLRDLLKRVHGAYLTHLFNQSTE